MTDQQSAKAVSVPRSVLSGFLAWMVPLAFSFVLTPKIITSLGLESYGLYALIMGIIANFSAFNFNVGRALTKQLAANRSAHKPEMINQLLSSALALCLLAGIVSAAILVLLPDWVISDALGVSPNLRETVRLALSIASVGMIFTLLTQVFAAVPIAQLRFDLYAYISGGSTIVITVGDCLLAWRGMGLIAIIGWNAITTIGTVIAYIIVVHQLLPQVRPTLSVSKSLLLNMLSFGGAVTAYQVLGNLLVLFERGWLTRSLGPTAVSYYVIGMTIAIYVHSLVYSLTLVVFPMASNVGSNQATSQLRILYMRSTKYVVTLVVFLAVTVVTGRHQLLTNWMGHSLDAETATILAVLVVTYALLAISIVPWQLADALGFPTSNVLLSLLWLVIVVPLGIWLVPSVGTVALAYARLIAIIVTVPGYVLFVERRVFGACLWGAWSQLGRWVLFAGGLTAVAQVAIFAAIPDGWLWFLLAAGASGGGYLLALIAAGYVNPDERRQLLGMVFR